MQAVSQVGSRAASALTETLIYLDHIPPNAGIQTLGIAGYDTCQA